MRLPVIADSAEVQTLVRRALEEDVGGGDATTASLVPADAVASASIVSRGNYVVSGSTVARTVCLQVDGRLRVRILAGDSRQVRAGDVIMTIRGPAASILTAERTALNFMQRMTGIATMTAGFVARARCFGVKILDTRKTTPGLRVLEKYAVLCGGGTNHRMGLYDKVLIKDNHRILWNRAHAGDLGAAVKAARKNSPGLEIEIEVEDEKELVSALAGRPDWILLDNMKPATMRRCVKLCAGRSRLEASGGITAANIDAVARTGVDAISLGCLTHSAPAADLSLEF
ncbi:MAG: carboxylating nicotinate-nucleotide diphosphorylase [bacterium]